MVRRVTTPETPLPFGTRLWYAWVCFFKILFDGFFAQKIWSADHGLTPSLPEAPSREREREVIDVKPVEPTVDAALQLLSLLQREGRFIDFLEEDVTTFSDADVGAAARVVHQGCRKALRDHAKLAPVRAEEEGNKITVSKGTPPSEVKLIGNVAGEPPFTGALRHKGWRVKDLHLPQAIDGHDVTIVAPAEVEL